MSTTCPTTRLLMPRPRGFTEAVYADMRFVQQQTDCLFTGDRLVIQDAL